MTTSPQRSESGPYPHGDWDHGSLDDLAAFAQRIARQLLGEGPDADDVSQDAVVATWAKWRTYGAPTNEGARSWLVTCIRNGARQLRRSSAARRAREEEAGRAQERVESPDGALLAIERQRHLLDLLGALPGGPREALVERFLNGRSVAEAADLLGVPHETLRTRTRRGLALLRERIAGAEGPLDSSGLPCIAWIGLFAGRPHPLPSWALQATIPVPVPLALWTMKKLTTVTTALAAAFATAFAAAFVWQRSVPSIDVPEAAPAAALQVPSSDGLAAVRRQPKEGPRPRGTSELDRRERLAADAAGSGAATAPSDEPGLRAATVRFVDAGTGVDLVQLRIHSAEDEDDGMFVPHPRRVHRLKSMSALLTGNSPIRVTSPRAHRSVWVTAPGYVYARATLDFTDEAAPPQIVPLERSGTLAVAVEPAQKDGSDAWLRLYGEPDSVGDCALGMCLADLDGGPARFEHVPAGTWFIRLERGSESLGAKVVGSAKCTVAPDEVSQVTIGAEEAPREPVRVTGWVDARAAADLVESMDVDELRVRLRSVKATGGNGFAEMSLDEFDDDVEHPFQVLVEPGGYEVSLEPWGQSALIDVPEGGLQDVVVAMQPPAALRVQLVDDRTGAPVPTDFFAFVHEARVGRTAGNATLQPLMALPGQAGLFQGRVSPGLIRCILSPVGYRREVHRLDVKGAGMNATLRLSPAAVASVRLLDGGAGVTVDPELEWNATSASIGERSEVRAVQGSGSGHLRLYVDEPGIYRVQMPELAGFEPKGALEIEFRVGGGGTPVQSISLARE